MINYLILSVKPSRFIKIVDHTENFPLIWADVNKIERVFLTLSKNAIEAMPNGGMLEIRSRQDGEKVDFTFSDTGIGTPQGSIGKMFTPLFTTKS